ncbi:MAG TPA: inorganic diphosphatase [Verrucomicrobiae bacterium]|jgi:inorganic pyrophosphatase
MKKSIEKLEAFDKKEKYVNVIVETPKGSRVKLAFSFVSGLFEFKRALPEGLQFPLNFGFIPGTLGEDGDPLDILILNEEPLVSGCLVKTRLLGIIKAEQTGKDGTRCRNDRLIGIGVDENDATNFQRVLDEKILLQIEFFFRAYNRLDGKKFQIKGTGGINAAKKTIVAGQRQYRRKAKS